MHRSRPSVLVTVAALAACSTRGRSDDVDVLAQDRALVATLHGERDVARAALPDACGATVLVSHGGAVDPAEARRLTRLSNGAEIVGDLDSARSLLRRAADLDPDNKSVAYHLGRASEAVGDDDGALRAYCRFLSLAPTKADAVEARHRVAGLARATGVAAGGARTNAPAPRRVAIAPRRRAAPASRSAVARAPRRGIPVASATPATSSRRDEGIVRGSAAGEVVEASAPAAVPPRAPRTTRRRPTRAQGALVGAASGAIVGAVAGRSVKGALIGAAAGGLLGGIVVGENRVSGRAMRY